MSRLFDLAARLRLRGGKRSDSGVGFLADEEKFRNLTEGSIAGICVQRNLKLLFANQALADIYGYESPESMLGMDILSLYPKNERAGRRRMYKARLRGENVPGKFEGSGLQRDGSVMSTMVA